MTAMLLNLNTAAIVLFGGAIAAIAFNWLVLTDDRQKFQVYVGTGTMWAWMAYSGGFYFGDAYGFDGGGFDGGDFGGGFDGAGDGGGCGGCGGGV